MTVSRRNFNTRNVGKTSAFAKGKKAVAICQRSGFKYKQSEMVFEPGTGLYVHYTESDKSHNLITDSLNFPSEKLLKPEGVLKYTSPDVELSIGQVISPVSLNEISGMEIHEFYAYPGTSVTTEE